MRATGAKRVRAATPSSSAIGLAEAPSPKPVAPQPTADGVAASIASLHESLDGVRGRHDEDPFSNPIALLSLEICQLMSRGELDDKAAEALIQRLTRDAFGARATTARTYLGELDPAANETSIRNLLAGLARDADGRCRSRLSAAVCSASIMASSSPPTPPSAGPWICR